MRTPTSIAAALVIAATTATLTNGCGSDSDPGSTSGGVSSCNLKSEKYMRDCAGGCGGVMSCAQFCPSCDALCQVTCTSDVDCAAVGAGVCKHPSSTGGEAVCTRAPTTCKGASTPPPPPSPTSTSTAPIPTPKQCKADGQACATRPDCCSYASGDGECVASVCVPYCATNSECDTGCCRQLQGTSKKACAPARYCQ